MLSCSCLLLRLAVCFNVCVVFAIILVFVIYSACAILVYVFALVCVFDAWHFLINSEAIMEPKITIFNPNKSHHDLENAQTHPNMELTTTVGISIRPKLPNTLCFTRSSELPENPNGASDYHLGPTRTPNWSQHANFDGQGAVCLSKRFVETRSELYEFLKPAWLLKLQFGQTDPTWNPACPLCWQWAHEGMCWIKNDETLKNSLVFNVFCRCGCPERVLDLGSTGTESANT